MTIMARPVRIGVEIEYKVMKEDGSGVPSGYRRHQGNNPQLPGLKLLQKAARLVEPGCSSVQQGKDNNVYLFRSGAKILPDAFNKLETVTSPSTDLNELRDQLWLMKEALLQAASDSGYVISGAACPIAYTYESYPAGSDVNKKNNNAGMHIHIEAPDDRSKIKLANALLQIIPELVVLSTNSSVYAKIPAGAKSMRLLNSAMAGIDQVQPLEVDPNNPLIWDDPDKRHRFVTVYSSHRKTVELRGFDTPITIDWAMSFAALVQCYATKVCRLFVDESRNTVVSGRAEFRRRNFLAAAKQGMAANFFIDPSYHMKVGKRKIPLPFLYHQPAAERNGTVPATTAANRLLYYIRRESEEFGLEEYLTPLRKAVADGMNQADLQLIWLKERGYEGYFAKLREVAANPPIHSAIPPAAGAGNWLVVRQRSKEGADGKIYLHQNAISEMGLREGDRIRVFGYSGELSLIAARDMRQGKIRLNSGEAGLGKSDRERLGVSMFDPIQLDTSKNGTNKSEKTGRREITLSVVAGDREDADFPPVARLSGQTLFNFGLREGDEVELMAGQSQAGRTVQSIVRSSRKIGRESIGIRKAVRKSLSVGIGDPVKLLSLRKE